MSKKKHGHLSSSIIGLTIQDLDFMTQKDSTLVKKFQCKKCSTIFDISEPFCPECNKHGYNILIADEIKVEK
ncbi:MAG: hypothetical protein K9J13_02905 [Saprospiraceae bacterium]|nr:hypothetical protein [Saprospiraceae bacterium]